MKRAYGFGAGLAAILLSGAVASAEPVGSTLGGGDVMEEIVVTAKAPVPSDADERADAAPVVQIIEIDPEQLAKDALVVRPEVQFAL
jgi:hypothetical protein